MLEYAGTNVVRVPTKPDRLARSTVELLSISADLSKRGMSKGGERLDTRAPLMDGPRVTALVVSIISTVAHA